MFYIYLIDIKFQKILHRLQDINKSLKNLKLNSYFFFSFKILRYFGSKMMELKQSGIIDSLFQAKVRDNGTEADYTEEEYNKFCNQLERAFPVGTLDFTGQQIGMSILTKLTKILRESRHIRSFRLYGNLIRDHGIHALFQLLISNPGVVILDIGCNDFTNQAVPCLIDIILNTSIKSLQIGATGLPWHNNKFNIQSMIEILSAIQQSYRIVYLGLSGLKMSVRHGARRITMAEELATYLRDDNILKSLSISDCGFTPKEMELVLLSGLIYNPNIKFLDMHISPLLDPNGTEFMRNLSNMKSLTYLDVSNCHLSASAGVELAGSLKRSKSLIVLNLSNNQIGDEGFMEILKVLLENQTLTELDVSNNDIGSTIAELLGKVIEKNQVLYSLDLTNNFIGDESAFAIASSIGKNEGITKLSIASCRISDEGAIAICHSLVKNTVLRKLYINNNFLTRESGYRIIDALRGNEHIFVLDLSATQIDHFVIKAANDLCIRNKQIQKETDLQPLKKQLVQLSIQQTKMPEAESRLKNLENKLDEVVNKIVRKEGEIEAKRIDADGKLHGIRKDIQDIEQLIQDEEKAMDTLDKEGEKLKKDFDTRYQATMGDIEKEKALISSLEKESDTIDENMKKFAEEHEKKKDDMLKEIEELQKLLEQTLEVMNDPEAIKNYQEPELEFLKEEDPLFLVDQIDDLRDAENKGKKKKGKGKKGKKAKGK